jgi:hypothetical protein
MASKLDREKVKRKIALIRGKIDADIDPYLLNEYRLLFKKGFSFFRRSWAAAYLLMLCDQGQGINLGRERGPARSRAGDSFSRERERPAGRNEGPARRDGGGKAAAAPQDAAPRPFLAEEESRRLFISIGRNRRVFPREILGLIITRAQAAREDIGTIRILDSYSFVQVRDSAADAIIEALNGTMFRGRPITVNYARLKREEGQTGGREEPAEIDAPAEGEASAADIPADAGGDGSAGAGQGDLYPDEPDDFDGAPEPEEDYPAGSEQGDDQADKEGV